MLWWVVYILQRRTFIMFQCAQTRENSLFGLEENVLNYVTLNFLFDNSKSLTFTLDQALLAVQDKADGIISPQEYFLYDTGSLQAFPLWARIFPSSYMMMLSVLLRSHLVEEKTVLPLLPSMSPRQHRNTDVFRSRSCPSRHRQEHEYLSTGKR